MARKNKENKNMALSAVLRDEGDSSEDDYRRKRDKNNQVVYSFKLRVFCVFIGVFINLSGS